MLLDCVSLVARCAQCREMVLKADLIGDEEAEVAKESRGLSPRDSYPVRPFFSAPFFRSRSSIAATTKSMTNTPSSTQCSLSWRWSGCGIASGPLRFACLPTLAAVYVSARDRAVR